MPQCDSSRLKPAKLPAEASVTIGRKMKKIVLYLWIACLTGMVFFPACLQADVLDECKALKAWLTVPYSAANLEAERDAKLDELHNPVKGEFETTTQFELRKQQTNQRIAAIKAEYSHKINDGRAAHEAQQSKLRQRFQVLLRQSRETLVMEGVLGAYDADSQKFRVSIPAKTFQVVVPLAKAQSVKENFNAYQLKVTRQLDETPEWTYLEASLEGKAGVFTSTDKAPGISSVSNAIALIPPNLSASISFNEPSGNNMLDAEETAQLTINISNKGKGPANMVEASLDLGTISGITYPRSVYFGEIKAGANSSKTVELSAGQNLAEASAELRISFKEQNGFPPDDKVLKFNTKAALEPDIYIADIGIDDSNKNGKIEPAEQVELTVRIHNRGAGTAKAVVAEVQRGEGVFFVGDHSSNSFPLGDIASGAYKDLVFSIVTNKTAKNPDLSINLRETRERFSKLNQPLNLAFYRSERTADAMVVQGKEINQVIGLAPSLSIDIEQDIPMRGKPSSQKWAVIFGIENYRNVSSVTYARRDAQYMKEYFIKTLGIPSDNIYFKCDDAASLSEFKTVFDPGGWLHRNASGVSSEIYIYYSGHGAPDPDNKKAYLLPSDGNPNYASISGYELNQLYSNLAQLNAKQITLFLDSCFSGADRDNEIILASARPVFISTALPSVASNLAVFSAASGSQISSGYSDMQHGLFSYFLMKGLKGDADANGDKKISQQELGDYLRLNVSPMARRMGREQEPQLQSVDSSKVLLQW